MIYRLEAGIRPKGGLGIAWGPVCAYPVLDGGEGRGGGIDERRNVKLFSVHLGAAVGSRSCEAADGSGHPRCSHHYLGFLLCLTTLNTLQVGKFPHSCVCPCQFTPTLIAS